MRRQIQSIASQLTNLEGYVPGGNFPSAGMPDRPHNHSAAMTREGDKANRKGKNDA